MRAVLHAGASAAGAEGAAVAAASRMSARVIPLEDSAGVAELVTELTARVASGEARAVALVVVDASGGLEVSWGASRTLGVHAGSILRGAAAYLGARMDLEAIGE